MPPAAPPPRDALECPSQAARGGCTPALGRHGLCFPRSCWKHFGDEARSRTSSPEGRTVEHRTRLLADPPAGGHGPASAGPAGDGCGHAVPRHRPCSWAWEMARDGDSLSGQGRPPRSARDKAGPGLGCTLGCLCPPHESPALQPSRNLVTVLLLKVAGAGSANWLMVGSSPAQTSLPPRLAGSPLP